MRQSVITLSNYTNWKARVQALGFYLGNLMDVLLFFLSFSLLYTRFGPSVFFELEEWVGEGLDSVNK
jgi:hypothetical protein